MTRLARRLFGGGAGAARERVDDAASFARFLYGRAAFVAQKAVMDHIQGILGPDVASWEADPDFAAAYARCRSAAFEAALLDMAELGQIYLRHAGAAALACPPFVARAALAAREGWAAADPAGAEPFERRLGERLAHAALASPRLVHRLGEEAAQAIEAALPARRLGPLERETILNSLRFQLCRAYADLEAAADAPALMAAARAATATPTYSGTGPPP